MKSISNLVRRIKSFEISPIKIFSGGMVVVIGGILAASSYHESNKVPENRKETPKTVSCSAHLFTTDAKGNVTGNGFKDVYDINVRYSNSTGEITFKDSEGNSHEWSKNYFLSCK